MLINPPTTFIEWKTKMDSFAGGHDNTLYDLEKGVISLGAGNAVPFYTLVKDAYQKRKLKWIKTFQDKLAAAKIASPSDLSLFLSNITSLLKPLKRYCSLPCFPADLQAFLKNDLQTLLIETKNQIKKQILRSKFANENSLLLMLDALRTDVEVVENAKPSANTIAPTNFVTGRKIL